MSDAPDLPAWPDEWNRYQIRLRGRLDGCWSDWFEGFTLDAESDGTTTLTGPVADQAALHGLLRRVSDLGVTLIGVAALGGTAPGVTAPGGTAPGVTEPGGTAPGGTAPGGTAPRRVTP